MDKLRFDKKYRKLFRNCPLFAGMEDGNLSAALDLMGAGAAAYDKGEFLHFPYTPMERFGMILSGVVEACMDDLEGSRMIMAEVTPGGTFGESLCFLEVPESPVYVFASEPTEVLWLSPKNLFVGSEDPFCMDLQRRFTAMLAARTLNMNKRIQVLSKIRLRDKIMTYFSQIAQQTKSRTFQIPMNRNDLAAYLGVNRSALSRELSMMKKEGLIDYYRDSIQILK